MSKCNDPSLQTAVRNALLQKSTEELIYILYNQEHFVADFTDGGRRKNRENLEDVKKLNRVYEGKKQKYDELRQEFEKVKAMIEDKDERLLKLTNDSKPQSSSLNNIISEIEKYLTEKIKKPKEELIKNYMNLNIGIGEFKEKFEDLAYRYQYYMLVLNKLGELRKQGIE